MKSNFNGALTVATILSCALILVILNTYIYIFEDIDSLEKLLPVSNFLIFLLVNFIIFSIKRIEKNVKIITEANLLKTHLAQVEELLKSLQSQKHEHTRHIQTLQAMLYLEEFEKAKEYIDGIAEEYWNVLDIVHVGHPALTALLNSKKEIARSKKIDFAFTVKCDISNIYISPWDLCSIVGNLIDNALEASMQLKNERRVAVEIKQENGYYVIYVYNTGYKLSEKTKQKMFEPGYTTKNSEARGYGLYLVKKLVDQYNGKIEIISKGKTTLIVYLPDRREK